MRCGERLSLEWKICVAEQTKEDRRSHLEKRPLSFVNVSGKNRKLLNNSPITCITKTSFKP